MEFDELSLFTWINSLYLEKSKNVAEHIINKYENIVNEDRNKEYVEVTLSLSDCEMDIGMIMNMAFKLIYDKGYTISPKVRKRDLIVDNSDDDINTKEWKFKFIIGIFKQK